MITLIVSLLFPVSIILVIYFIVRCENRFFRQVVREDGVVRSIVFITILIFICGLINYLR